MKPGVSLMPRRLFGPPHPPFDSFGFGSRRSDHDLDIGSSRTAPHAHRTRRASPCAIDDPAASARPSTPADETAPVSDRPPIVPPSSSADTPRQICREFARSGYVQKRIDFVSALSADLERRNRVGNADSRSGTPRRILRLSSSWAFADHGINSQSRQSQRFAAFFRRPALRGRAQTSQQVAFDRRVVEEPGTGSSCRKCRLSSSLIPKLRRAPRDSDRRSTPREPICFS